MTIIIIITTTALLLALAEPRARELQAVAQRRPVQVPQVPRQRRPRALLLLLLLRRRRRRRRRPGDGRGGAQVERRQRGHFWSTFFEPREARPLCMLSTVSPI